MNVVGTLVAVVLGYLVGSLSGARLIGRGVDWSATEVALSGTGATMESDAVSPELLNHHRGARAGLTAGAIDVGKAVVAVLAARIVLDADVAALVGLAVVVGHVFPAYHRFRGGFGVSPILGALLVLDPVGLAVALVAGALLGLLVGSAFVMTEAWPVLAAAWAIAAGRPTALLVTTLAAAVLYTVRSWPIWREARIAHREDDRPWGERIADVRRYPHY